MAEHIPDNRFDYICELKEIFLRAIKEWSLYTILCVPVIQTKIMESVNVDSSTSLITSFCALLLVIFVPNLILMYRLTATSIREDLLIPAYIINIIKHIMKIAVIYLFLMIVTGTPFFYFFEDIEKEYSLFSKITETFFYLSLFVSNYGVSLVLITGSSKNSIRSCFRNIKSGYSLLNAAVVLVVISTGVTYRFLPDFFHSTYVKYSVDVIGYVAFIVGIILLTRYAQYLQLFKKSAESTPENS
jgi:hypothetical protein